MTTGLRRLTRQAADETWVDRAARSGLAVRGIVFLILAYLVARIASGALGGSSTQKPASGTGVAQAVAAQTGGRVVLAVLGVGLAGYALFSLIDAILHHNAESSDVKRWGERVAAGWGAVVYAAFGAYCLYVAASGTKHGSSSQQEDARQSQWSARVLRWPAGWLLLGIVGFAVLAIAVGVAVQGVRRSFRDNLDERAMSPTVHRTVLGLGTVGCLGRAALFAIVGWFVAGAAIEDDPSHGQGFDGSARRLADDPAGSVLLWAVVVGLVAFGVYLMFEARYRRV